MGKKKTKVEDIDWQKAIEVVRIQKRGLWYEDYDEAEGQFMGWRKAKSHKPVTFKEFSSWWKSYNDTASKTKE